MKKNYINPKTIIVNVQVQGHLMIVSGADPDGKRNVTVSDDPFSGSGMMSRESGSWDDED